MEASVFYSDSSCTRFGDFLGWVNRYLAGGGAYGKTDGTDGFSVENWPFRSPFLRNIVHLFSGAWAHNREVGFFRWRRNPGFCTGCDGAPGAATDSVQKPGFLRQRKKPISPGGKKKKKKKISPPAAPIETILPTIQRLSAAQ